MNMDYMHIDHMYSSYEKVSISFAQMFRVGAKSGVALSLLLAFCPEITAKSARGTIYYSIRVNLHTRPSVLTIVLSLWERFLFWKLISLVSFSLFLYFLDQTGISQGFFLTLSSGINLGRALESLQCVRYWTPGQLSKRKVLYPYYYFSDPCDLDF